MDTIINFLTTLAASDELRWVLIAVVIGVGVYFFWTAYATNHLSTRAQLDSRFDALLNAQVSFTNEWEERYKETQRRLDDERNYGKQLAQRIEDLSLENATLRGELNVLKQQLGMFIACPNVDCPFKSIRDTLH